MFQLLYHYINGFDWLLKKNKRLNKAKMEGAKLNYFRSNDLKTLDKCAHLGHHQSGNVSNHTNTDA